EPGRVPCPSCGTPLPAGREHAGRRLRCTQCQAVSYVQILSRNTLQLKLLEHPPVSVGTGSPIVIDAPEDETDPDPSAVTLQVQEPDGSSTLLPLQAPQEEQIRNRGWTRRIALVGLALLAITGVV